MLTSFPDNFEVILASEWILNFDTPKSQKTV